MMLLKRMNTTKESLICFSKAKWSPQTAKTHKYPNGEIVTISIEWKKSNNRERGKRERYRKNTHTHNNFATKSTDEGNVGT